MSQDSACPTRQQLDELEALMQRMLSLPVSDGEEPVPPPEPKPRAAVLPPRLRAIPDPPPWEDAAPVSETPPPPPPASSPRLIARPVEARPPRNAAPVSAPLVHGERVSIEEEMANVPEVPLSPPAALEPPPPPPAPRIKPRIAPKRPLAASEPEEMWWLAPLVWTNHAFDRCTLRLGPSGRWLRGARGRAWIGWSGIVLFAVAAGWALLEWLGLMW